VINIATSEKAVKFAMALSSLNQEGVFETIDEDNNIYGKYELANVMKDSIAKTCLHILVSLTNQYDHYLKR